MEWRRSQVVLPRRSALALPHWRDRHQLPPRRPASYLDVSLGRGKQQRTDTEDAGIDVGARLDQHPRRSHIGLKHGASDAAALMSAVLPELSRASGSAPLLRSSRASSGIPFTAAHMSAVRPSSSVTSTFTPSARIIAKAPAATTRGNRPRNSILTRVHGSLRVEKQRRGWPGQMAKWCHPFVDAALRHLWGGGDASCA